VAEGTAPELTADVRAMMKPQVRINQELAWGLVGEFKTTKARDTVAVGRYGGVKNFVMVTPRAGQQIVVFTNGDTGMRVRNA